MFLFYTEFDVLSSLYSLIFCSFLLYLICSIIDMSIGFFEGEFFMFFSMAAAEDFMSS